MKVVKNKIDHVARKIDAALHSSKTGKTLKHASHGGHAAYLAAVFFESHYKYGLIAGGLVIIFVLNLWLHFDDAE